MHKAESSVRRPCVVIIHAWVAQHRRAFYEQLRPELDRRGVDLVLVHGQPTGAEKRGADAVSFSWSLEVDNRIISVAGRELVWQPALGVIRHADLVIAHQQSRMLQNYALFGLQLVGSIRFALWGHGRNLDESGSSVLGEAVKRLMSTRVHWWFAYNDLSARIVTRAGFPSERITVVCNAIDTKALGSEAADVDENELEWARSKLGLETENVGLFVGGMYDIKRLPFLLDACQHVRRQVPDFEMILIGDGPERALVERWAEQRSWMHMLGPLYGRERATYWKMAKLLLMPGRVGLVVLDSFVVGAPLVTIADSAHAPEVEYLVDGVNGVMAPTGASAVDYAAEITRLLKDENAREKLVQGALESASKYTIEEMVDRYASGIEQALAAPSRSRWRRRRASRRSAKGCIGTMG